MFTATAIFFAPVRPSRICRKRLSDFSAASFVQCHSGAPTQASLRSLRKLGCVRRTRNPVTYVADYWIPGSLATLGPRNDGSAEEVSMANEPRPIRRVVTGNDDQGRSCVVFDSAAPNVNPGAISRGTCMTDIWVYQSLPADIAATRDDGSLPFHFEPPPAGGHLRIVQSSGKPADDDP